MQEPKDQVCWAEVLPVHPAPKEGEALSSYVQRLARSNGLSRWRALDELVFRDRGRGYARAVDDLPLLSARWVAQAAGLLPEAVEGLTFARLLSQYGISSHPHWATSFLRGSLAPWLRYCPLCVKEREEAGAVWMDLAWRVKQLKGCERHGCVLQERCSGCEERLPLLWLHGEPGRCPFCGWALRAGAVQGLSAEGLQETVWSRAALTLLCGNLEGTPGALAEQLGQRLCYLREVLCGWSAQELAWRMGVRAESIERMDQALSRERGSLQGYWEYARLLGTHVWQVLSDEGLVVPVLEGGRTWRQERETKAWIKWEKRYNRLQHTRACWVPAWEERGTAIFARSERSAVSSSLGV